MLNGNVTYRRNRLGIGRAAGVVSGKSIRCGMTCVGELEVVRDIDSAR
jgi:hypothetical protein